MKFASCCFATFLLCLVSFHQSSSFRLHHGKPDQNEINELLPGRYYIQNVATGLVIGAVNGQDATGHRDIFGSTMESLEEAQRDPEQKLKVLWELDRGEHKIGYTRFHSVGPYAKSDLEKEDFCMYACGLLDRNWSLVPRGEGIWGIRHGYWAYTPIMPPTCLTGYGLHQGLDATHVLCNLNDPMQSWRLIREDSS